MSPARMSLGIVRLSQGVVLALASSVLPAIAADAAQVPERVDLATLMRVVREVSPRLAIERQGVVQAQADRITAAAYPNPVLSYGRLRQGGGQPSVFEGTRQQETSLELPLLIAGQRAARIERAERDIEAARARVAAGSSTLAAEAAAAFVGLLAAQEKSELLMAARGEIARLRDVVSAREASGAASRYDVARAELEVDGVQTKLDEARADVADRAGGLAALLGLPGWKPTAIGPLRPLDLRFDARTDVVDRATETPPAIAAVREEAAAHSGVDVARRERWPVPTLSVGRTWTSEPFGAANFVGLSVEIPILDSRRGPLARAEADAHAATLRRQLVTAEVAANLQRLRAIAMSRQAAFDRFQQQTLTRVGPLRQMAEDAYRFGRGTILDLLDATRSLHEIEHTRIELTSGLFETQLRLLALLGELE